MKTKYDRSKTYKVGNLRYHFNYDQDGSVVMENAQTIEHYEQLKGLHPDDKLYGVFFAFNDKQFEEGYNECVKRGTIKQGEKVARGYVTGMFGTPSEIERFLQFYDAVTERIKNECDPQEVYFAEYNNYECMISYDGDKDAYRYVVSAFGEDVAKKIRRVGYVSCDY